jgi:protein-tyrosine kinase
VSKIHQAIRRLERLASPDGTQPSTSQRDFLEDISRYIAPKDVDPNIEEFERTEKVPLAPLAFDLEPRECIELSIPSDSKLVASLPSSSMVSERYRALKTKIFQLQEKRPLKTLLVTSASISDGKTLTAINLALTMAHEIDRKVLLVEADLRRPSFQKCLGFPEKLGLSDFLLERCPLEQIVYKTNHRDLYLAPAGTVPDNPTELLNSERMQRFLKHVSERFHWVVIDSPPTVAVTDADLLAGKVDGVIFVVRSSYTPTDLLAKAIDSLKGKNLLGVVFNGYEDDEAKSYSSYYHDSGKS